VLAEVDAELLGAGAYLLAVDAAGERLVLELLLDRADVDLVDPLATFALTTSSSSEPVPSKNIGSE
jgi:hypothetical protein